MLKQKNILLKFILFSLIVVFFWVGQYVWAQGQEDNYICMVYFTGVGFSYCFINIILCITQDRYSFDSFYQTRAYKRKI